MTITIDDLKTELQEVTPTVLTGSSADLRVVIERVNFIIRTPELFAAAVIWFAGIQASVLLRARSRMGRKGRHALFVPDLSNVAGPVETAIVQIVTAIANDDMDMVTALVRPWAFLTHGTDASRELIVHTIVRAHMTSGRGCDECRHSAP